uniref:Uncharacterized protein LOC101243387 n=1 Tax=Phallusia mammillata TaxID=59560 RepID=A0A6F9DJN3_9ASCI|nr:uncharacterized protein LOC101243387 [Phallusia mammillata]
MSEKRYEFTLSPELLEKAVTELNEPRDNTERLKAIDELKANYKESKYGPLLSTEDGFLLRFLRAKKFNQKKAVTALHNYHEARQNNKEIFDKVNNPILLKEVWDCGIMVAVEGAGLDGSCVVLERAGLIKKGMDIYALTAYGVLTMEKLLENEQHQICGLQTMEDLENFNISIITKVSPIALAKMNSIWQDAMPLRIKAMHMFHEGTIMDILMTLFKPFLKEKLVKRIHMHGNSFEKVQNMVDTTKLPPCFGGTGPSIDTIASEWNEKMKMAWSEDTYL